MKKNSAKILADLVLSTRSNAFKDLCTRSIDENQMQSDKAASRLRSEIETDLKNLLSGKNWDAITDKIEQYAAAAVVLRIRPIGDRRRQESLNVITKKIRLGANEANLVTVRPDEQTAEQWVYGLLAQALETGDVQHLMLCEIESCGKIFYRKSLKGRFCRDDCRWQYFNSYEERHERYKRTLEKRRGRPTRAARHGPRRKPLQ